MIRERYLNGESRVYGWLQIHQGQTEEYVSVIRLGIVLGISDFQTVIFQMSVNSPPFYLPVPFRIDDGLMLFAVNARILDQDIIELQNRVTYAPLNLLQQPPPVLEPVPLNDVPETDVWSPDPQSLLPEPESEDAEDDIGFDSIEDDSADWEEVSEDEVHESDVAGIVRRSTTVRIIVLLRDGRVVVETTRLDNVIEALLRTIEWNHGWLSNSLRTFGLALDAAAETAQNEALERRRANVRQDD
jgi:hypothetical protein